MTPPTTAPPIRQLFPALAAAAMLAIPVVSLAVATEVPESPAETVSIQEFEERAGIRFEHLKLASAGYMIDFRYRVVDTDKAAGFLAGVESPHLVHEASGARLIVPSPAYVGPLSQAKQPPKLDRTYFIFFTNPGRFLERDQEVWVVLGDLKLGPLTVR